MLPDIPDLELRMLFMLNATSETKNKQSYLQKCMRTSMTRQRDKSHMHLKILNKNAMCVCLLRIGPYRCLFVGMWSLKEGMVMFFLTICVPQNSIYAPRFQSASFLALYLHNWFSRASAPIPVPAPCDCTWKRMRILFYFIYFFFFWGGGGSVVHPQRFLT